MHGAALQSDAKGEFAEELKLHPLSPKLLHITCQAVAKRKQAVTRQIPVGECSPTHHPLVVVGAAVVHLCITRHKIRSGKSGLASKTCTVATHAANYKRAGAAQQLRPTIGGQDGGG